MDPHQVVARSCRPQEEQDSGRLQRFFNERKLLVDGMYFCRGVVETGQCVVPAKGLNRMGRNPFKPGLVALTISLPPRPISALATAAGDCGKDGFDYAS